MRARRWSLSLLAVGLVLLSMLAVTSMQGAGAQAIHGRPRTAFTGRPEELSLAAQNSARPGYASRITFSPAFSTVHLPLIANNYVPRLEDVMRRGRALVE